MSTKYNLKDFQYKFDNGFLIIEPRPKKPWKGKTVIFTGKLESYYRHQAKENAELLGARVKDKASGYTCDYVIVGSKPSSKLQWALDCGADLVTEAEFKKLVRLNLE